MSALSATARREYYLELGNALPTPVNVTQERHELRFTTAIEAFEALRPGDAYEARLAVRIVLCGAHAVESLRRANIYSDEFSKETRYCAQACSFMREERSAKRMLMQEQKVRLGTEAVAKGGSAQPAAATAAPPSAVIAPAPAPSIKAAPLPPAQAAAVARPVPPAGVPARPDDIQAAPPAVKMTPPQPAQAAPVARPVPLAVAPLAAPTTPAAPRHVPAAAALPPSPGAIEAAETFALENSAAAAQIRLDRGVTARNKALFHDVTMPADPAVIDALVRGTSELLTMLDGLDDARLDAAD
jgi:hypothetical protein